MALAQVTSLPRLAVGAARLVLIGRPPVLNGMLQLANPGADKIKLKSASLRLKDSQWGDPHVPLRLDVSARVAGGTAVQVPVTLTVDPRMPPGDYRAEVHFEGHDDKPREAVLKVLEHRALAITPETFELYGAAGATVVMPAVISNLGNVPFVLPKVALVALGEDAAVTQLFHVAMARKGAEGHQAALDAYAQLVAASEVDAAKALIGAGAGEAVAPGESRETTLAFELPARLSRHRTYHGTFSIGKLQCGVELEVADAPAPAPTRPSTARK